MKFPMMFGLLMLVASCAATGGGSACAGWQPIRLSEPTIDALSDQDAQDVLAHNRFGREIGCWK